MVSGLVLQVSSLKNVRLRAAEAVKTGERLRLGCNYELESAPLYSVKWYFGDNEFYRFVPKESPPTRVFPLDGFNVDVSKSNEHQVILQNVQRNNSGYYSCEVSADAPLFHTDMKKALVMVTEEPKTYPVISPEKLKYSNSETIRVNCSSYSSFPAANITWYINGRKINETSKAKISFTISTEHGGLETIRSRLEAQLSTEDFYDGTLKISCEASQYSLYKQSNHIKLQEDAPQLARVLSPTPTGTAAGGQHRSHSSLLLVATIFVLSGQQLLLLLLLPNR